MRKKLRNTKARLVSEVLKWWIPYLHMLMDAQEMGYNIEHKKYKRRYRWWIEQLEGTSMYMKKDGTVDIKHKTKRMFTSGSLRSCITALKLMTDWRGHD